MDMENISRNRTQKIFFAFHIVILTLLILWLPTFQDKLMATIFTTPIESITIFLNLTVGAFKLATLSKEKNNINYHKIKVQSWALFLAVIASSILYLLIFNLHFSKMPFPSL